MDKVRQFGQIIYKFRQQKNPGHPALIRQKPGKISGASKGARTLDLSLGKAALYQLSYARTGWYFLTVFC